MLEGLKNKFFRKRLPRAEAFSLFKEVLEGHNKGLEMIAEMGEKLGGEFLFDVNYVRPAYTGLSAVVSACMGNFGLLTRGRYPELSDSFGRIDARVRAAIDEVETVSGRHIIYHENITWEDAAEVGGKNANIAEVKNLLRLKTPEGFALTLKTFADFISHNGLEKAIGALETEDPGPDRLRDLRVALKNAEVPVKILSEIDAALARMKKRSRGALSLAVRSSAAGEDGDYHSFAGIYESVLNVPPDAASVGNAYKEVVASLFTERVFAYRGERGISGRIGMAVCCMAMVDAAASGVAYSADPSGAPEAVVSSAWGLGVPVVDGTVEADRFTVARRDGRLALTGRFIGNKAVTVGTVQGGGVASVETAPERGRAPSISDRMAIEIAAIALRIEAHFRQPQDIEWAVDEDGDIFVLQARPLKVGEREDVRDIYEAPAGAEAVVSGGGLVVQAGAAAGPVYILKRDTDIPDIPKGAVVLSKTDSASLVRAMHRVSAIITDTGSPTSHMAALCREFRVPTVVGAGTATHGLRAGEVVTLDAGDTGYSIYRGVVRELLKNVASAAEGMEGLHEYRKKRQILRFISPLSLIDPLMDEFAPERCRSVHDVLRFIHEKSVAELMDIAAEGAGRGEKTCRLELSVPAGIIVMDIGGGLAADAKGHATIDDVTSRPLRAVLAGMTRPGMWRSEAVSMKVGDLLSSMVRMPEIADGGTHTDLNLAVASKEYVNLSMRFGYHFNMVDCYMSDNPRDNHISFRFSGGATDMTKRSRRIRLLSAILDEHGLNTKSKGDLIIARISGLPKEEGERTLEMLGRLIAYSRQLDAQLNTDEDIILYSRKFKEQ